MHTLMYYICFTESPDWHWICPQGHAMIFSGRSPNMSKPFLANGMTPIIFISHCPLGGKVVFLITAVHRFWEKNLTTCTNSMKNGYSRCQLLSSFRKVSDQSTKSCTNCFGSHAVSFVLLWNCKASSFEAHNFNFKIIKLAITCFYKNNVFYLALPSTSIDTAKQAFPHTCSR